MSILGLMPLLHGFHELHDNEPPPRATRWFRCRYCDTTFYGGRADTQPVREEMAAATTHERECYASLPARRRLPLP